MKEQPYLMTGMELAWGYLMGYGAVLAPAHDEACTPREALERVVRRALERPPCGVAFSGGRDSSLVLAIATHVARRDGLPEPVPITRIFPAVAESHEREFQEAVVRHLGIRDWHRVVIDDELDVVGPLAARHLVAHGVMWPPAIAGDVPLVEAVPGGCVMDGEGGDEVLGAQTHRVAGLTRLVREPRPLRWRRVRAALGSVAPAPLRGHHARRRWAEHNFVTWLRPAALESLVSELVRAERDEPLSFAASVRTVPRRRTQLMLAHNRRVLARQHNVGFVSPLLDPEFVHAVAREGGLLGPVDRASALRSLSSDLLPEALLRRTDKAAFTRCYMSSATREFAAVWNGEGVDPDVVDPDELRRIWLSDSPIAPTAGLVQAAWLGTRTHSPS